MALLKQENGLIYNEQFNNPTLDKFWSISTNDSNRFTLTEKPGSLKLKHGNENINLLANISQYENLIIEVSNIYIPSQLGESGGIVITKNNNEYISFFEEYKENSTNKLFPYLMIQKKGDIIYGFNSEDGNSWSLSGCLNLSDVTCFGICLNGQTGSDYEVNSVKFYKSHFVTITDLVIGNRMEFFDSKNQLLKDVIITSEQMEFKFNTYPITGKFKFYDENNNLLTTVESVTLWGGDRYKYGCPIEIYYNGRKLDCANEEYLGKLTNEISEFQLEIVNYTACNVNNAILTIAEYDDTKGFQFANLSLDTETKNYSNSITIPSLSANSKINVWLKIQKELFNASRDLYKFYINLTFQEVQ